MIAFVTGYLVSDRRLLGSRQIRERRHHGCYLRFLPTYRRSDRISCGNYLESSYRSLIECCLCLSRLLGPELGLMSEVTCTGITALRRNSNPTIQQRYSTSSVVTSFLMVADQTRHRACYSNIAILARNQVCILVVIGHTALFALD